MISDLNELVLVKNVKIPFNETIVEGSILIENGFIKKLTKLEPVADIVIDGEGLPIIPGGIDIHAHVYDPDYVENEDWRSGSLAALFGCITTLIDMPLRTIVDNEKVIEKKIDEARRESYVNYGVTGGFIFENNIEAIDNLSRKGVKTFKVFTCSPFKTSEESIPRILSRARVNDAVVIFHAEDEYLLNYTREKYIGENNILSYHLSRSSYAEASAIMKVGYAALETSSTIHIAHVSSSEGVEAIKFLKSRGLAVTAETCPHYLFFTREDSVKYGNYLKISPSLKTSVDRETLWINLRNGVIDIYASDNAPAPKHMKNRDVWSAWSGIPNLEIMGPFLYTYGVKRIIIDLHRYIEVFSTNPAKVLDLYPLLGSLQPGSLANLVILDTRKPRRITASDHHHKVDWTPWENMELYGHPRYALVNGYVVIEKNELVGKPAMTICINELIREMRSKNVAN